MWEKDGSKLRIEESSVSNGSCKENATSSRQKPYLLRLGTQVWAANDTNPHTMPLLWQQSTGALPADAADKIAAHAIQEFDRVASHINTLLGLYKGRMIFLSTDHWVCSIRIDRSKFEDPITFHFPMPHSWRRSNRPVKGLVTSKGDVVFAVEGDPVVVKNGL
jgi:hypothetical protein